MAILLLSFEKQNVNRWDPDKICLPVTFLSFVLMKATAVLKFQGATNLPA